VLPVHRQPGGYPVAGCSTVGEHSVIGQRVRLNRDELTSLLVPCSPASRTTGSGFWRFFTLSQAWHSGLNKKYAPDQIKKKKWIWLT
jgi:hypothetical protein